MINKISFYLKQKIGTFLHKRPKREKDEKTIRRILPATIPNILSLYFITLPISKQILYLNLLLKSDKIAKSRQINTITKRNPPYSYFTF